MKNILFNGGNVYFKDNPCSAIGAYSGSAINFSGGIVNFHNNYLTDYEEGGAIRSYTPSTIDFEEGCTVYFTANKNRSGGAISGQMAINFSGGTVEFSNNTATSSGGTVYVYGTSEINFNGGIVNFFNNTASRSGGAIYARAISVLFNGGNVTFSGNKANDGSAIYLHSYESSSTVVTITTSLYFIGGTVEFKNHITSPIHGYSEKYSSEPNTEADVTAINIYMFSSPIITGSSTCRIDGKIYSYRNYAENARMVVNLYNDTIGNSLINKIDSNDYTFTLSDYTASKCLWQ